MYQVIKNNTTRPLDTLPRETGVRVSFFSGQQPDAPVSDDNPVAMMHGILVSMPWKQTGAALLEMTKQTVLPSLVAFNEELKVGIIGWHFADPLPIATHEQAVKVSAALIASFHIYIPGLVMEGPGDYCYIMEDTILMQAPPMPLSPHYPTIRKACSELVLNKEGRRYKVPAFAAKRWLSETDVHFSESGYGADDHNVKVAVHRDGLIHFNGPRPFTSWSDLVDQAELNEADTGFSQELASKAAYDGESVWYKTPSGWLPMSQAEYERYLVHVEGLSSAVNENGFSETGAVLARVCVDNRVVSAIDYLYLPEGVVELDGKRYLNRVEANVCPPAPPFLAPGAQWIDFEKARPNLGSFISKLFRSQEPWQLETFLAWLKHFYLGAHTGKPTLGQVLVLKKGHYGAGVDLVDLIQTMVGRVAVNMQYLQTASGDMHGLTAVHSRVTAAALDSVALCRLQDYPKWGGRKVILVEVDEATANLAPDMDLDRQTHVSFFNLGTVDTGDISRLHWDVPFLARFLLEWQPPPEVMGAPDRQLAVKAFWSKAATHREIGPDKESLIEVLENFLADYHKHHPGTIWWQGTSRALCKQMEEFDTEGTTALLIKGAQGLGHRLARLKRSNMNLTSYKCKHTQLRMWRVGYELHKPPNYYMLNQDCINNAEYQKEWLLKRSQGKLSQEELFKRDAR